MRLEASCEWLDFLLNGSARFQSSVLGCGPPLALAGGEWAAARIVLSFQSSVWLVVGGGPGEGTTRLTLPKLLVVIPSRKD